MRAVDGPCEGARAVVVEHLQMLDPEHLNPSPGVPDASFVRIEQDKADWSRWFYESVGAPWHWVDRLAWTRDHWREWTDRPEHHLFALTDRTRELNDAQALGYAELEQQADGDVEITYLGLRPGCFGHGRGGWLLTRALEVAWALPDTRRVWVHTCDLDSPAASANYRSRGMREFARTVEWRVPDPRDDATDTVTL